MEWAARQRIRDAPLTAATAHNNPQKTQSKCTSPAAGILRWVRVTVITQVSDCGWFGVILPFGCSRRCVCLCCVWLPTKPNPHPFGSHPGGPSLPSPLSFVVYVCIIYMCYLRHHHIEPSPCRDYAWLSIITCPYSDVCVCVFMCALACAQARLKSRPPN